MHEKNFCNWLIRLILILTHLRRFLKQQKKTIFQGENAGNFLYNLMVVKISG